MTSIGISKMEPSFLKDMNNTRLFVVIQGTIGGLAGMVHGANEIMLGNQPTAGLIADAKTGAFSILPTYLASGIAAVIIGLALIIWTIGFIHRKNGPAIFLLIAILLFLVGGGIAQVGFFIIAWGVSTRINRPVDWWKNDPTGTTKKRLAGFWWAFFTAGYIFLLTGIAIWLIATPPGTPYPGHSFAYQICWLSLILGVFFQLLTIVSGFARDIDRLDRSRSYASSQ